METRAALRFGCALTATLMPLACLTRTAVLPFHIPSATYVLMGEGAYVIVALAAGASLLQRSGWAPGIGSLAAAASGAMLGGFIGDPFLMAVPVATVPFCLAALALPAGEPDDGAGAPSEG